MPFRGSATLLRRDRQAIEDPAERERALAFMQRIVDATIASSEAVRFDGGDAAARVASNLLRSGPR